MLHDVPLLPAQRKAQDTWKFSPIPVLGGTTFLDYFKSGHGPYVLSVLHELTIILNSKLFQCEKSTVLHATAKVTMLVATLSAVRIAKCIQNYRLCEASTRRIGN